MKLLINCCLLFLFFISPAFACNPNIPAQRIITLAPNLAALVAQAGAGEKLVGVSKATTFPVSAVSLPQVASASGVDIENIVALHPDLIIAWQEGTSLRAVQALKDLNFCVLDLSFKKFSDIAIALQKIGVRAGTVQQANLATQQFNQDLKNLNARYGTQKPLRVFYESWNEPLMTLTDQTLAGQAIAVCGGENIFAKAQGMAPMVDMETVMAMNPDVIVSDLPGVQARFNKWPTLQAVKLNHVILLPEGLLAQSDTRMIAGIQVLCEHLALVRKSRLGYTHSTA